MGIQRQISHPMSSYKPCKGEKPGLPMPQWPHSRGSWDRKQLCLGKASFQLLSSICCLCPGEGRNLYPHLLPPLPSRPTQTHRHTDRCASPPGGVLGKRCPKKSQSPKSETSTSGRSTCKAGTWLVPGNWLIPEPVRVGSLCLSYTESMGDADHLTSFWESGILVHAGDGVPT